MCANPAQVEYVLIVHESRWEEFLNDAIPNDGDMVLGWQTAAAFGAGVFSSIELWFPPWGEVRGHEPIGGRSMSIKIVRNNGRDCVVDQLNAGAAASTGQLLIGIMDDLEAPQDWDLKLLGLLPYQVYPDIPGPYAFGGTPSDIRVFDHERVIDLTGEPTEHIVYGAMTRARYEKQGFVLDPEFESMFADNYLSHVAHKDSVVIKGRHLGFKHVRPQADAIYALQNRKEAYAQGQATFLRKVHGTRALFVCLPGETFSYQVVTHQFTLLNHLNHGMRFLLTPVFGFSTNVHCTRIEMAEGVLNQGMRADLVLWCDDDNYLLPAQFEMLLADLDAHPELAGVVGWCWCDNDGELDAETGTYKPWMISCGRQGANLECKRFTQADLLQAVESGQLLITSDDIAPDAFWSGFPVVLMRGSALETLGARAFCPIVRDDVKYGFVSEDAAFFYRAHQAGLKFGVDLRVQVPHLKVRAIAPQHIPLSEKAEALKARGEGPGITYSFLPRRAFANVGHEVLEE